MFVRWSAIGLVILACCAWRGSYASEPTVVIHELMWMGSSISSSDEWIELRNLTGEPIDISGWYLTKKSSGVESPMLTLPPGSVIAPQGYYLMSNYPHGHASTMLDRVPDLVTTDVALSNTALQVKLYAANTTLMDTADDGVGNPASGKYDASAGMFASMERNRLPGDGSAAGSWHPAVAGSGWKTGANELGTPGGENSRAAPIANAGPDTEGGVGIPVQFDGSDSQSPEGHPISFAWNFGDGATAGTATPLHTYTTAGEFRVTLMVADGILTAQDEMRVTISPAPTASPSETSAPTSSPSGTPSTSCRGVRLTELLPNPVGTDTAEYIEFLNPTAAPLSLHGCKLWIGTSRVYSLPTQSISPGGYFLLEKAVSKLSLANTGAQIRLVDSDGVELERVEYLVAKEGQAWIREGEAWAWTATPTPNAANRIVDPSPPSTKTIAKKATGSTTKTSNANIPAVALGDLARMDIGTAVAISGRVITPYGTVAARTIHLEDESGTAAVLLSESLPVPKLGDVISLTGTLRQYQGRPRVSVTKKDTYDMIGHVDIPVPEPTSVDDIDADRADTLVRVTGLVSKATASQIIVDDGTGEIAVSIRASTGIMKPAMKVGDRIDVTGIVSTSTSGMKIIPRIQDDIRVERVLSASDALATSTTTVPTTSPNQTMWYWLGLAVAAIAAAAKPAWHAWRRKTKDHVAV